MLKFSVASSYLAYTVDIQDVGKVIMDMTVDTGSSYAVRCLSSLFHFLTFVISVDCVTFGTDSENVQM
jgi:hypothetical protein